MDAVAEIKNAARVAAARGLRLVGRAQDGLEASGGRALRRLGLPTRTDLDRLERAVSSLHRAADALRRRS